MDSKIDKSGSDPFSLQLRSGFRWLRFEDGLEREYRAFMMARQRRAAQIFSLLGLSVWVVFAFLDVWRIAALDLWDPADPIIWLWLGLRWFVLVFIVTGLLYETITRRPYDRFTWWGYVFFGCVVATSAVIGRIKADFAADSTVIIIVMAAFLPLGFVFRRALAAILIVAAFSLFVLSFDDGRGVADRAQMGLMVLVAVPVAAIGGYLREYSERYNYLLMGVLNQQAGHDPLTGLSNRRQLSTHAASAFSQAERTSEKVFIAVADIDYFKQYNDLYGHPEGDRVLVHVGNLLAKAVRRPLDLAARVGGEEFCLFFFGADAVYVEQVLGQMALALKALNLPHEASPFGLVSLSAGMAEREEGEDFYALFSRADAALYEAKRKGRNRINWA